MTPRTELPVPNSLRLVLLSFLMLFVELALIRWAGSNVIYLSYFSNFTNWRPTPSAIMAISPATATKITGSVSHGGRPVAS